MSIFYDFMFCKVTLFKFLREAFQVKTNMIELNLTLYGSTSTLGCFSVFSKIAFGYRVAARLCQIVAVSSISYLVYDKSDLRNFNFAGCLRPFKKTIKKWFRLTHLKSIEYHNHLIKNGKTPSDFPWGSRVRSYEKKVVTLLDSLTN